jgi:SH3-like domain-containing protein
MRGEGLTFYYAHLHRPTVRTGARVRSAEPLGEVGNTGNARGTPPHLHFGVFRSGEAVDPYAYLVDLGAGSPPVEARLGGLGRWARTGTSRLRLRAGPGTSFPVLDELPGGSALRVEAAARAWYRVRTGQGRLGFVAARFTTGTGDPLARPTLERSAELLAEPAPGAPPVASLSPGQTVAVRATAGDRLLVTAPDGTEGWLPPV